MAILGPACLGYNYIKKHEWKRESLHVVEMTRKSDISAMLLDW